LPGAAQESAPEPEKRPEAWDASNVPEAAVPSIET
jgi:hypothetical protein